MNEQEYIKVINWPVVRYLITLIIGFVIIVAVIQWIGDRIWKQNNKKKQKCKTAPNEEDIIRLGLLGAIIAVLVAAFFCFNLQTETSALYFWFIVGLSGVLMKDRKVEFESKAISVAIILILVVSVIVAYVLSLTIWRSRCGS